MAHMFYKLVYDTTHPTAWWLDEIRWRGKEIATDDVTNGAHYDPPGPLTVAVRRPGEPMAFSFALGMVPVVSTPAADVISTFARDAIERYPVEIDGIRGRYEMINVVRVIDAIDRGRSVYKLWKPEDNRPDRLGAFRAVDHLVIKDDIRQDACIFRPAGWQVVLIVSAKLKKELEKIGKLGVLFRPLEGGFTAN